jgi:hypothetical protein
LIGRELALRIGPAVAGFPGGDRGCGASDQRVVEFGEVPVHPGRHGPASLEVTSNELAYDHAVRVQRFRHMLGDRAKEIRADCGSDLPRDLQHASAFGPVVASFDHPG